MRIFLIIFFLWVGGATAQTYPDYQSRTVNDFADLLTPAEETALSAQLDQLRDDTGVEMAVVTLATQADYAPGQTLETFATGLFSHWGIGDAEYDDGVLVMVIRDDRTIRIELGAGYARDWDETAEWVIDTHFSDAFAQGEFARGLQDGSSAIIDEIITPYLDDEPVQDSTAEAYFGFAVFGIMFAAVLYQGRRALDDLLVRFRACPSCGQRALRRSRHTLFPASRTVPGSGLKATQCGSCDYAQETPYVIPRVGLYRDGSSGDSGGGFGGGSSGGGGGSGRF